MNFTTVDENAPTTSATSNLLESLHGSVLCLDHVAIAVACLEDAVSWYTRNLGFRVVERRTTRGEHTGMISAVLVAGSAVVVLVQGTEPASQVSKFVNMFGAGVQHLAFAVDNLDRAIEQLTAGGAQVDTPIIKEQGIRQVFLRRDAQSGVRVELIERTGGDFSDKSVEQLFRAFEVNDLV